MSAIVKTFTTVVFAASMFSAAGVSAQEMDANFFSSLTSPDKSPEEQNAEILSTIESMMKSVSEMEIDSSSNETITIEEIDRRNRAAQRLQNDLAIRDLKFKEMQAKIDMLLLLEKTRRDLIASTSKAQEAEEGPEEAEQEEKQITEAQKQMSAAEAAEKIAHIEQMSIPRIVQIVGAGGKYSAQIESVTGIVQDARVGSILVNGFRVDDITLDGVIITGDATGRSYFVVPTEPTDAPSDSKGGDQDMQQAIDMSESGPGMF